MLAYMCVGLHVKYILLLLLLLSINESVIFSTYFRKISEHQISWISDQWKLDSFCAKGRTDKHDEVYKLAFREKRLETGRIKQLAGLNTRI